MKGLLIVLFFGFCAAAAIPEEHDEVDSTVHALERGLQGMESLWLAVHMPEYADELHAVESHMKTKFGEFLKEALDSLIGGIKSNIAKVKDISKKVGTKIEELKQKLGELGENAQSKSKEAIEIVRQKVHEIIHTIEDSLKNGEYNLDKELDKAAKLKVQDLIKKIRQRVTQKVSDIRKYVKEIAVDNEVVNELNKILDQLSDSQLKEILTNITDLSSNEIHHLKELYYKLKELAGKTDGVLQEKIYDLLNYFQGLWRTGIDEVIEKFKEVRGHLLELIGQTKNISVEAVKDALDHLQAYKKQLGGLYEQLVKSLKNAVGLF